MCKVVLKELWDASRKGGRCRYVAGKGLEVVFSTAVDYIAKFAFQHTPSNEVIQGVLAVALNMIAKHT
jgi:hypothetical protein